MKCAGSSVEYALAQHCGETALCTGGEGEEIKAGFVHINNLFSEEGEEKWRFHAHTWPGLFFERILSPEDWKDYQKITIVRNPWDAAVSFYWWAIYKMPRDPFVKMMNISPDVFLIQEEDSSLVAQRKFETFLNIVCPLDSIRPEVLKVKCTPLDYFAETNELFIDKCVDYYLRFENLQSDYNELCHKLNLEKSTLPKFKTIQRKLGHHYSYYYSNTCRDAIEMRFPHTIQKFKYRFIKEGTAT